MSVFVTGMWNKIPVDAKSINTTSNSSVWSKDLSPFLLGPIEMYDSIVSKNFENCWQYAKVYPGFTDEKGNPNSGYWSWAKNGWNDQRAHRYPMGRGAIPLYSYWNGEKLSYIQARKKIYIPLYYRAVVKTKSFLLLQDSFLDGQDLYLRDYDGYDHKKLGMSYEEVIHLESRKMGHAFILAMMLEKSSTLMKLVK